MKPPGKVLAELVRQRGAHVANPMGAGMITGLDNVLVDVVAFESMVDLHPVAQVSIVFLGGNRSLPAVPRGERRSCFPDLSQESPAVSFAVLQEQSRTAWKCQGPEGVMLIIGRRHRECSRCVCVEIRTRGSLIPKIALAWSGASQDHVVLAVASFKYPGERSLVPG